MRIVYATCSACSRLDDDAADFALGLARMAQHAGHRVDLLVRVPAGEGDGIRASTVGGVAVGLLSGDAATGRSTALAGWLHARRADVVHLLDAEAGFIGRAARDAAQALVLNLDVPPPAGADATAAADAGLLRHAAGRIAPDADVAARWRALRPDLAFDVVAPGVDLLAIAADRRLPAAPAALRVGWSGGPWPALERLLEPLGVAGRPVDGRPAERLAALREIDLLCLRAPAPRRPGFEARAAGVPVLVAADEQAVGFAQALAAWAGDAGLRAQWRRAVRPPPRIEETAFLYESLYRRVLSSR